MNEKRVFDPLYKVKGDWNQVTSIESANTYAALRVGSADVGGSAEGNQQRGPVFIYLLQLTSVMDTDLE